MNTETQHGIKPLSDRADIERKRPSGILIPDAAADAPARGTVIAVGEGRTLKGGKARRLDVSVGDVVLFGAYSGTELIFYGETFLVMREDEILMIIDGEDGSA